jgi:hypothetical protein
VSFFVHYTMRVYFVLPLLLLVTAAAGWQLDPNMEKAADRLMTVCDRCDGERIADVERLIHERFPLFLNPTLTLLNATDDDDESGWSSGGIVAAVEEACASIKTWTDLGFSRQCLLGLEDAICSTAELVRSLTISCSPETGTEAECQRCIIEKSARTRRSLWVIKRKASTQQITAEETLFSGGLDGKASSRSDRGRLSLAR